MKRASSPPPVLRAGASVPNTQYLVSNLLSPLLSWRWLPVIVWMGVIFFFSSQPQSALNFGQPAFVGKLAHVAEYAILGWLIRRARGDRGAWWQSGLIAIAYAITDEIHQSFIPGRHALATDVLIDAVGISLGIVAHVWRESTRPNVA